MNKKRIIIIILVVLMILAIIFGGIILRKKSSNVKNENSESNEAQIENINNANSEEKQKNTSVDIIDVNSKTRPYAISINNTPVAVKVQTGLNKAYLIYEIPTEGNTSRLLALYKDIKDDVKIGTIRSSRHNFIDYALESNAIFVHYGWSHYAEDEEKKGIINYINGLFDAPFWRENPENLASEHTAYTSILKLNENVKNKKFNTESDGTIVLNYNSGDIDLTNCANVKNASKVIIPYGSAQNTTSFEYDFANKIYYRLENNNYCIDYVTKEKVNTKNIIVQKIDYEMCKDNYYWNLKTIGSGKGFYITNGKSVPITWKKENRTSKTKYYYEDGTEIEVSDGRTYIELQTNKQQLTIE